MEKTIFEKFTLTLKEPQISQFRPKCFPFDCWETRHICLHSSLLHQNPPLIFPQCTGKPGNDQTTLTTVWSGVSLHQIDDNVQGAGHLPVCRQPWTDTWWTDDLHPIRSTHATTHGSSASGNIGRNARPWKVGSWHNNTVAEGKKCTQNMISAVLSKITDDITDDILLINFLLLPIYINLWIHILWNHS